MTYLRKFFAQRGQSLVEVALFLPLFLILVGGVVEVGQMLITNNRVNTVANTAARFAADGGDNAGMAVVALNTITQTLPIDTALWDIWAIRGIVNEQGTNIIPESWEFTPIYGEGNTTDFATINEGDVQTAVLNDLQRNAAGEIDAGSQTRAKDIQFVGTLVLFDAESILGLNIVLQDFYTVQAMTVMRTYPSSPNTNGCSGFPIAVEESNNRSLGTGSAIPFPFPDNQAYPASPNQPKITDFPANVPDVPLREARPGYVYKIQQGFGTGAFGWLSWNENPPPNAIDTSLTWPGNSMDYTPLPGGRVAGYIENGDPSDRAMHIGDRVTSRTGAVNSNAVHTALEDSIDNARTLRLIVWKNEDGGYGNQGSNGWYRITGFIVMRLHGYKLSQSGEGSWILAEFISWDDSCGQVNALPGQ